MMEKPGDDILDGSVIASQGRKGRTVPELIEQTKLIPGFTPVVMKCTTSI